MLKLRKTGTCPSFIEKMNCEYLLILICTRNFYHLGISKLLGLYCIKQCLPYRVAMQFGMDQDLPTFVTWPNESAKIAGVVTVSQSDMWNCVFSDVTTQYLEWWKQSVSHLQNARSGTLPQKSILVSSVVAPNRSDGVKRKFVITFSANSVCGLSSVNSKGKEI